MFWSTTLTVGDRRDPHLRAPARRGRGAGAGELSAGVRRRRQPRRDPGRRVHPAGRAVRRRYAYDNVIDANVRAGQFDRACSAALTRIRCCSGFECSYDNQANVDLAIERMAFDAVAGPQRQWQRRSARASSASTTCLTGGIADLLADLFLFSDPVNYNTALNMLSGSVYANYLQSFPSLGVHHNDILAKATDCEVPAWLVRCSSAARRPRSTCGARPTISGARRMATMRRARPSRSAVRGVVGVDTTVGGAGSSAARSAMSRTTSRQQFGDEVDAGGFQVGLYGVYDPGTFYVKAMTTYSWYDGDSDRNISFAGLAPGATFGGSPKGIRTSTCGRSASTAGCASRWAATRC